MTESEMKGEGVTGEGAKQSNHGETCSRASGE